MANRRIYIEASVMLEPNKKDTNYPKVTKKDHNKVMDIIEHALEKNGYCMVAFSKLKKG
jgi:hypothetical protein